jgi:uncharacterized membrane protein YoaK (UPF0700 family)
MALKGVRLWLPILLSATAGAVDAIGFLALGGLFTAHITGNLVVVAAHYAIGGFGQVGPLLAVPVFVAVLAALALLYKTPSADSPPQLKLLVLHAGLLSACLGLGLQFGPFRNADSPMAVVVGMLAVTAMATQNAMVKLVLVDTPSTAVMTTNTTQLLIDLVAIVQDRGDSTAIAKARQRARVTFTCMAGFVCGCMAGAALESRIGIGALALPVILATAAIPLGDTSMIESRYQMK